MKIVIDLDGEMDQYGPPIRRFTELMVEKLRKNIHKGKWKEKTREQAWRGLLAEIRELREAHEKDFPSADIIRECADVANFAMIMASIEERT